ncbi:hypothetical protein Pan216_39490 [Planctomycetes bacterium Pan216]|uniref:PAAR motif protein n=1 Tax=Kolteria novifilia TaxID=2527975 RepID=A0A518B7V6_9BACT|nr:hypothetical protein Pan216_39490 [Planctomycetes bacterium Pan216]
MPPAGQLTSMNVCPMVTGVVPHVGGAVVGPGAPTILVCGLCASTMADMAICVGPPATIAEGEPTVLFEGRPAAVVGLSLTDHGGDIVGPGAITVEIA